MRIAFSTFGCKINQVETDGMRQAAVNDGNVVVPFDGDADVYVVNTCSVTARSDYQCRQAIRAAVRRNAGARVIVTGCYAATRGDEVRKIPGVSLILPNEEKLAIASYLPPDGKTSPNSITAVRPLPPARTRAVLKIQDGCNSRCSYCIVPLARGGSRSVPREDVIALFDEALKQGAPEVVLSGIHIGRYGSDLPSAASLTELVRDLGGRRGAARIRLSSIEPTEITAELIAMLGKGICRHLHIPLQSGDDGILHRMNRQYDAGTYRDIVTNIAAHVPGIAVGADVMVGFPGEGEEEFRNTYDLIESLPITHLHVFSFSPRPGTPASSMPGQVHETVKKQRNESLRRLGMRKNMAFRKNFLGAVLPVVVERTQDRTKDLSVGLTDNYIKVSVHGAKRSDIGRILPVRITAVEVERTEGIVT